MGKGEAEEEGPIFQGLRRYYCEYCGICRSKKNLIASHILTHHKEEMEMAKEADGDGEGEREKSNTCQECGATFKKPAYLKQHMQSHSLEISKRRRLGVVTWKGLRLWQNRFRVETNQNDVSVVPYGGK